MSQAFDQSNDSILKGNKGYLLHVDISPDKVTMNSTA